MVKPRMVSVLCLLIAAAWSQNLCAQVELHTKRQLNLAPQAAKDTVDIYHLLPAEEEQEPGNAVPVLLRMVYEQSEFMSNEYDKLRDYAGLDIDAPKLNELHFDGFARQAIRAGSMSFATWEYPLRADNPYTIMLGDMPSQRQLIGQGMRAWGKQRLAKGDIAGALAGIKAQLGCARHCTAAPIGVCHLVGLAIANLAFDNLELAMQYESCPNLYWSLGTLSPTLGDLGPMVRWELWASPARLEEPLPAVGSKQWERLAQKFADAFEIEVSNARYTEEDTAKLQKNIDRLAQQELGTILGFSAAEIDKMSTDERALRWYHLSYCRFRTQVEPLAYQSSPAILAASKKMEAARTQLMQSTGALVLPYPAASLAQTILTCRNFERRVKLLQTLEAIRDYSSQHNGELPASLEHLRLPAPSDPFTGQPFHYSHTKDSARLLQVEIEGGGTMTYEYELKIKRQ